MHFKIAGGFRFQDDENRMDDEYLIPECGALKQASSSKQVVGQATISEFILYVDNLSNALFFFSSPWLN